MPQKPTDAHSVQSALDLASAPYTRPAPHVGPIRSIVAGRTDHLPMDVKPESFVIPADVVSGLGEGNTENGHAAFDRLFNIPGGRSPAQMQQSVPPEMGRASGGEVKGDNGNVPIMAAGGEYVVPPEIVQSIGKGNMKRGHNILHEMVKHLRAENIKKLKKLPNPHQ